MDSDISGVNSDSGDKTTLDPRDLVQDSSSEEEDGPAEVVERWGLVEEMPLMMMS